MKHLTVQDILPEDYRFIEKPDKNFSPERNYAVINEVIKESFELQKQMWVARQEEIKKRVDILSYYGRHALRGGEKTLEQYIGREGIKQIYGEQLLEKLRIADSIKRLNRASGNTKFENYYLT